MSYWIEETDFNSSKHEATGSGRGSMIKVRPKVNEPGEPYWIHETKFNSGKHEATGSGRGSMIKVRPKSNNQYGTKDLESLDDSF